MTDEREPLQRTPEEAAEDEECYRRYGPWKPMEPPALADFMAGFSRAWWIVGGTTTATSGATWPLLDGGTRDWLRAAVRRLYPDHAWLGGTMASRLPVPRSLGRS